MAKTRRTRGGASFGDYFRKALPGNWGKSIDEIAADRKTAACAKKKEDLDKECGPGEASATDAPAVAESSAEAAGESSAAADAVPLLSKGGRSRRRRQTRRKYKGGKHRKGH